MSCSGVMESAELTIIARVLDEYCQEHQIPARCIARETAASMVIALYRHGYQTPDDLKGALDRWVSKH